MADSASIGADASCVGHGSVNLCLSYHFYGVTAFGLGGFYAGGAAKSRGTGGTADF